MTPTDKKARPLSPDEYSAKFGLKDTNPSRAKEALELALDIRKFEIQLYWSRAAYFWTFITVALGGLGAAQALGNEPQKTDLSVFVCSVGLFVSFAWYCANRGSKQWQENWENHVDLLEDTVVGPLYKVVISRPQSSGAKRVYEFFTGPAPFSVSKINQLISVYITLLWVLLLFYVLPPFTYSRPLNKLYAISIGMSLVGCVTVFWGARTYNGGHSNTATVRESELLTQEPSARDQV